MVRESLLSGVVTIYIRLYIRVARSGKYAIVSAFPLLRVHRSSGSYGAVRDEAHSSQVSSACDEEIPCSSRCE